MLNQIQDPKKLHRSLFAIETWIAWFFKSDIINLDSTIESDDKRLNIEGYNIIRAGHPGKKKGEGRVYTIKTVYQLWEEMIYVTCKNA